MRKLFIRFIAFAAISFPGLVFADTSTTMYYVGAVESPSPAYICTKLAPSYSASKVVGVVVQDAGGNYKCEVRGESNNALVTTFGINKASKPMVCSGVQVPNLDGVCAAPAGPDCSSKLPMVRRYNYAKGVSALPPDSYDGCKVSADELLVCRATATGSYCMWQVSRTGEKSTGTPPDGSGAVGSSDADNPAEKTTNSPPLPSDSKGNCPNGSVQAGVGSDGIPVCMGTGTGSKPATTPAPTSTTKQNTDEAGNTTETTETTSTNEDGSTTTTTVKTTTAPDGTRTVTGSTTTGPAMNGSQGQKDGDKDGFCKQNPDLTICRNSSVSGSCGQTACIGDAIQCATLRAAAAMQCAQDADLKALQASSSKTLGDAIIAGNDPSKAAIDSMIKGTEVDLSKPSLDQSGFIGGGSCLANKSFTVMGQSVAVDFSRLCNDIQPIRAIIMAVAFIAAYMIVSRSVLTA